MKLTRVSVTIRPWHNSHEITSIQVEVRSDNRSFTSEHYLPHNSFASEFDETWAVMKQELDRLIADAQKGEPTK